MDDAQKALAEAKKAKEEAEAQHKEAKAHLAKLAQSDEQPNLVATVQASVARVVDGCQLPAQLAELLAKFEADLAKQAAEAAAAKEAVAKQLPGDPMEEDAGLPSSPLDTDELVWYNSCPVQQEGQSDDDYDKAVLAWRKTKPAQGGKAVPQQPEGNRGRRQGGDERRTTRSRSRGEQQSS